MALNVERVKSSALDSKQLIEIAEKTLVNNDLGGYSVPTHGLYPFQWNWDSAITALGWMTFDEPRAWKEIELLVSGQWDNGMIPHILFHKGSDTYFPGPDVWGSNRPVKSTSISQPPVLATVARMMFEQGKDRALANAQLQQFIDSFIDYHLWWYQQRDPENTGLVCSYHPWESGMDNSPAWDEALAAVPAVTWEYQRCDTGHINAEQRPHKEEYDRFLYLVEFFKNNDFDDAAIYANCPYKVNDVSIVAILHRATADLLALCGELGIDDERTQLLADRMSLTQAAIQSLWSPEDNFFYSRNVLTDSLCPVKTTAGLLPLFAGLANDTQVEQLHSACRDWMQASDYNLASTHPRSATYEPQRYWRGPVWLHINWMIALGLAQHGFVATAAELRAGSRRLVDLSGYYEYFHADSGAGCGGGDFSWTAAMALYWLIDE